MNELLLLAITAELDRADDPVAAALKLGFTVDTCEKARLFGLPTPGDGISRLVWSNITHRLIARTGSPVVSSSDLIFYGVADGLALCLYRVECDVQRWSLMDAQCASEERMWFKVLEPDGA